MPLDNTFIWTDRNTNYLVFLIRLASIQEEQHTPLTYRRPKMQNYTFLPTGFNVVVGHFWSHCSKHIFANPRLAFLDAVSYKKPATNHNRA